MLTIKQRIQNNEAFSIENVKRKLKGISANNEDYIRLSLKDAISMVENYLGFYILQTNFIFFPDRFATVDYDKILFNLTGQKIYDINSVKVYHTDDTVEEITDSEKMNYVNSVLKVEIETDFYYIKQVELDVWSGYKDEIIDDAIITAVEDIAVVKSTVLDNDKMNAKICAILGRINYARFND